MRITLDQVRQVASLARLGLREEELEGMRAQLEAILGYVEQLEELSLDGVEGTSHVVPLDCPLREDAARPGTPRESLLGQAPRSDSGLFVVPRIIPD